MYLEEEEWRDIKGFEGLYQVSNLGNVRSFKFGKVRMMKLSKGREGYLQLGLLKNGKNTTIRVHRLVAEAFISNPNNFTDINHKDECKTNNRVDNLEWCTETHNIEYSCATPILQYNLLGVFLKEWVSMANVQRELNISASHICQCCKGDRKSAGGYIWRYASERRDYLYEPPLWI